VCLFGANINGALAKFAVQGNKQSGQAMLLRDWLPKFRRGQARPKFATEYKTEAFYPGPYPDLGQ